MGGQGGDGPETTDCPDRLSQDLSGGTEIGNGHDIEMPLFIIMIIIVIITIIVISIPRVLIKIYSLYNNRAL